MFDYVLILATAIDANNETINLAWGVAPKENTDHWRWSLNNLSASLDGLNQARVVIMSDRQKGLTKAVHEELPLATKAYCCKHIERNLVEAYGMEVKALFWRAVYAQTQVAFERAMTALKAVNPR